MKNGILIIFVCGLIGCASTSSNKEFIDLTYKNIQDKCYNSTSAQFDMYTREIEGKYITWTGIVTDVEQDRFNNGSLAIDMGTKFYSFGMIQQDNSVMLNKQPIITTLTNINLKTQITFTGKVWYVSNYDAVYGMKCHVSLKDWVITTS